jgi:hypothetical protein
MSAATSSNSVFAVRFAHPNTFGTSQTPTTLSEIVDEGQYYRMIRNYNKIRWACIKANGIVDCIDWR